MCPSTTHDDPDDLRRPNADPDDSGSAEPAQAGVRRTAERAGPWNSQCERFAQSIMLAARLGGGGNITFRYGDMVAEVEIRHSRAAEPELVQRTREMRLNALSMQEEKIEAFKVAAATKAAAKKAKRQRQKERKRASQEQQNAEDAHAEDVAAEGAVSAVGAESAKEKAAEVPNESASHQAAHPKRRFVRGGGAPQQKEDGKAALQPPPPGLAVGAMSGVHGAAMPMHINQDESRWNGVQAVTTMEQG